MNQQEIRNNEQAIEENVKAEKVIKEQAKLLVKMGCLSQDDADYIVRNWQMLMPNWKMRQYQNAASLLEHYRDTKWAISRNITDVAKEHGLNVSGNLLYDNVKTLVDEISDAQGCEQNITQLESVIRSSELSVRMLQYVDFAVECIKTYPNNGEQLYEVLFNTYISEDTAQLSDKQHVFDVLKLSKTTYYKLRKKALEIFSACIWRSAQKNTMEYIMLCMMAEKTLRP